MSSERERTEQRAKDMSVTIVTCLQAKLRVIPEFLILLVLSSHWKLWTNRGYLERSWRRMKIPRLTLMMDSSGRTSQATTQRTAAAVESMFRTM